jgi:hypothetical protein
LAARFPPDNVQYSKFDAKGTIMARDADAVDRSPDAPAVNTAIVATIGLHGSASTWVYNVVRELFLASCGETGSRAVYADRLDELPIDFGDARRVVIKSHHGSPELDDWLRARGAARILSLRDPRDAALSMAQRFRTPLQHTVAWLLTDCRRMAGVLQDAHLRLTYEERFFDQPATVFRIAASLDLRPDPAVALDIFARYATDAVRAFAARIPELPPERINKIPASTYDQVTHIHQTHIGDARSGKWRDLDAGTQEALTKVFMPFLEKFGYPP